MTRRPLLAFLSTLGLAPKASLAQGGPKVEPLRLSDADWKKRLSPNQYAVLRQEGTERAGTSPLNDEHRKGVFHCAGCELALFASETKFDSGTGWPSCWRDCGLARWIPQRPRGPGRPGRCCSRVAVRRCGTWPPPAARWAPDRPARAGRHGAGRGHSAHSRSGCFMRPACCSAVSPLPQK